ncbi:hypothetical protein N0V93_004795 [Gnomoniopsis smithogilvyi]|uniref:Uncharacterized protein n=1 Tax=Gnomoniopsis smithogilvyi TaxID=1191159 RepID=A0A9W8YTI1_9PEZI|nr:hypothetical protein N0V93_004795 [Gnomoniopsis smithogilvyi]
MAPAFKAAFKRPLLNSGKRSSAGTHKSSANKKAKFSLSDVDDDDYDRDDDDYGDVDDIESKAHDNTPYLADARNSIDHGKDLNDALDEEDEILDVSSANSRTTEQQIKAVLRPLGLESLYSEGLSFFDVLLDNSTVTDSTRTALILFREQCLANSGQRSSEPTDAFLNRTEPGWACNNSDVTGLWDDLIEKLVRLGVEQEDLVKPSGAWGATLCLLPRYLAQTKAGRRFRLA